MSNNIFKLHERRKKLILQLHNIYVLYTSPVDRERNDNIYLFKYVNFGYVFILLCLYTFLFTSRLA